VLEINLPVVNSLTNVSVTDVIFTPESLVNVVVVDVVVTVNIQIAFKTILLPVLLFTIKI
jgi:hypothetical protein